jgi:transposase-like protein
MAEVKADFHRIVYAENAAAARAACTAFERKWPLAVPVWFGASKVGAEELLTFFQFPNAKATLLKTAPDSEAA